MEILPRQPKRLGVLLDEVIFVKRVNEHDELMIFQNSDEMFQCLSTTSCQMYNQHK